MKQQESGKKGAAPQGRKKYSKPALSEFGRVRDLTRGATTTGASNDMAMGSQKT